MKTLILLLLTCLSVVAELPVRAYLSSSYLIPGETTEFIIETNEEISRDFSVPKSDKYKLQYITSRPYRYYQGASGYRYIFQLSSLHQGEHTIPAITLEVGGKKRQSLPVNFQVLSSSSLKFSKVKIGTNEVKYATAVFLPDRDLYIGETVPTEIKVYLPHLPRVFSVIEYGLPEITREGISAWRYQNPKNYNSAPTPFLLSEGRYFAITYRSTAHALKAGTVSLGEGKARPVFRAVSSVHGRTRWSDLPIYLPIEKIERTALPLPEGAPESFKGAVGNFTFSATLESEATASLETPLSVRLNVFGNGNLDKVQPPVLTDADHWKLFPATKKQRDSERRYLSGSVEFSQLLRPTSVQSSIPPFAFSFFNPTTQTYETVESPAIPLKPSADTPAPPTSRDQPDPAPSQGITTPDAPSINPSLLEAPVPKENMSSVLDMIQSPNLSTAPPKKSLWRFWHVIPALVTLWLLVMIVIRKVIPSVSPTPEKKAFLSALKALKEEKDSIAFLKGAANLSTTLPETSELPNELAKLRDQACFTPDKGSAKVDNTTRASIMKKLTLAGKSLLLITSLSLALTHTLRAEKTPADYHQEALELAAQEDYTSARTSYLSAYPDKNFPADIHNNLGTLYAKSGEAGLAMLNYRRALLKDPSHAEARQNLRYLERVHGSIVINRTGVVYALSKVPEWSVKALIHVCIWTFIIAFLTLIITNRSRVRLSMIILLFTSVVVLPFAIISLIKYPRDGDFAPPEQTAIITAAASVKAKTGASDDAELVIIAPPGSVSKVISQRGLWVYLEFTDQTRAWLNTKYVTPLLPNTDFQKVTPVENQSDL